MGRFERGEFSVQDIILLGKKIIIDRSKIVLSYSPDEKWHNYWEPKGGHWEYRDGYLIGTETGNKGGILLSREYYEQNVMLSFTVSTVLPASRDLNAVFCAHWNEETDYLGDSYVSGLNGWYEHKSGIERNMGSNLYATTTSYRYEPGTEVRICTGAIDGHCFLLVNGELVSELVDPNPLKGGHVGFSPYCTRLKIRDIEIRKIYYEPYLQRYEPEF